MVEPNYFDEDPVSSHIAAMNCKCLATIIPILFLEIILCENSCPYVKHIILEKRKSLSDSIGAPLDK